jgi:carboxymethylenebutenolidase
MFARKLLTAVALLAVATAFGQVNPIERTVTVAAAPLQVYQALCVDWQMEQWTKAIHATSDPRPGGAWQIYYHDGSTEQGIFEKTERAQTLAYTLFLDSAVTKVQVSLQRSGDSTRVVITHSDFGEGGDGERHREVALQYWGTRLPLLIDYLNQIPGSYLSVPKGNALFPAVLLLHDQFGLNRTVRGFADSLAENGYLAIAVDLFKGDVTGDITQAHHFGEVVNDDESLQMCRRAIAYLKSRPDVDTKRFVVWGLGYGGSIALRVAGDEGSIRACADWYGSKVPEQDLLARIACPVTAVFGDKDLAWPKSQLEGYAKQFTQAGVRANVLSFTGGQSFADPASAESYNAISTRDAWHTTLLAFDRALAK